MFSSLKFYLIQTTQDRIPASFFPTPTSWFLQQLPTRILSPKQSLCLLAPSFHDLRSVWALWTSVFYSGPYLCSVEIRELTLFYRLMLSHFFENSQSRHRPFILSN